MKVVLLGESGVGKTSVVRRLLGDEFELKVPQEYGEARLHYDSRHIPTMDLEKHPYKDYKFYDFGPDYKYVSPVCRHMDKAIIITDNEHTSVSKWYPYIQNRPFIIVVNKYDKQADFPQLKRYPEAICVSCKHNSGIDKIIEFLQE